MNFKKGTIAITTKIKEKNVGKKNYRGNEEINGKLGEL
jgi:hypothetical protein